MYTRYLNNDGTRWIVLNERSRRAMPFILILPDGTRKKRKADYYEQFGNFAVTCYRYCGERFAGFADEGEEITHDKACRR